MTSRFRTDGSISHVSVPAEALGRLEVGDLEEICKELLLFRFPVVSCGFGGW